MRGRPGIVLALLSAALLAVVAILLVSHEDSSPSARPSTSSSSASEFATPNSSGFDGAALPGAPPAPPFTLTDQRGRRVSLAEFRGRVVLLSFLYSDCGATCTVIAEQIRGSLDELPSPVPVLFVSADPAADTPASVRRFLSSVSLSGRVRYLTGTPASLRAIWRAYGVKPASAGRGTFDSYASVLLIDGEGRRRVIFQQEQLTPESLTHDIRKLDGEPTDP